MIRCAPLTTPIVVVLLLAACPSLHAQTSLDERLDPLLQSHQGKVSVAVEHLESGDSYRKDADRPMPTASLIKFPVMVEAYRQAAEEGLDLTGPVTLKEDDKVPGSGVLTYHFSDGASFPLRDAIRLMIAYSDNTATNLVADAIGLKATADTMERMGLPNTKLHSKVYRRDTSVFPDRSPEFGLGSTTADEMITLLKRLHARELVDADASEQMYEHLLNCQDDKLFKRFLPSGTKVAHKTGAVNQVRTSAGIIETPGGPVALCVLTSENEDTRWTDDNAAERIIARVAREVYDYFNRLPDASEPGDDAPESIRFGANGPAVESLQRRLNAALDPSPELSVDGDFGPATQAALIRFQRLRNLTTSGNADPETLDALGAEPEAAPPVPDPEEINSRVEDKAPADPIDGPPFVTAKAWVVIDADSGERIGGDNDETALDMASTTKIMTALVVLRLAEEDPSVLDEVVTFSERADRTTGSTAGVRAGERLTVRELLYGLMLPSGNDASVALGEHFGARLGPIEDDPHEVDPLPRFVAAMNRLAIELGLPDTRFANTHGLTAPGHHASALDLARLARVALENELFAEIVSTRRRGCTLFDPDETPRKIVWRNTNQLLPTEGYDGVKTGTTNAAGACLVAQGSRGDDRVIAVVLGSTSADARYTDARNLFRWAWTALGRTDDALATEAAAGR
jgi:D-alanyl-D-alanine carboxypeptidase (penicillin-binding protein 5/6)